MKLPESLAAALTAADEAYLIALCNKGTYNRAKKDLAALASPPQAECTPDGVQVQLGQVTCLIRAPLGDSRCSCPSSAVCRHRISAILWLQSQLEGPADGQAPDREAPPPQEAEPDFPSLRAYPPEKLVRQLGARRHAADLVRWQSGQGAKITAGGSVVTVELPWAAASVRLLEPLEHSTCSCHSKSFCVHKAEALFFWQLEQGLIPAALQEAAPAAGSGWDPEQARGVCQGVRQALAAQMATGLSRLPPSVCDTTERLAALCHTGRLPRLERALRRLQEEYAAYFRRSATYRDTSLLARFGQAWRLAQAIEAAPEDRILQLAGTFRDEYRPAGPLQLYLLGLRQVTGRNNSGYEGTVYYFWDTEGRCFYTYSDLRPAFYEKPRRRSPLQLWGMPCTLDQAWNCVLRLHGARVNGEGGLSGTSSCHADLGQRVLPGEILPPEALCTDFEQLLQKHSAAGLPERERLAVVRPAQCIPQPYDRVQQLFQMRLLDDAGRDLWVTVRYDQTEQPVIDALERLEAGLRKDPARMPVFFGTVYRDKDLLRLYPIEYFGPDSWQAAPPEEECP